MTTKLRAGLLSAALAFPITAAFAHDSADHAKEELVQHIDELFNDSRFERAFWGAKIESLDTGEVWYERNANKLFMPASNQKIPTTAGALLLLGPDFQFTTKLLYNGEIEDGVLKGDLIVWSNGDPTNYTRFGGQPTDAFESFAEQLKAKGIRKIEGDVIGDDNAFDDQTLGSGWSHGYLNRYYAAPIGALQINENYVDLKIIPPSTANDTATIEPNLPSDYYTIENQIKTVTTGRSSVRVNRPVASNIITVSGTAIVGGNSFEDAITLHNPTLYYATVLTEVLKSNEIEVLGNPVDIDELSDEAVSELEQSQKLISERQSKPLSEISKVLMKKSQNLYAETMPRAVAWNETGKGSFYAGARLIKSKLSELGVDSDSFIYSDGSGLTRLDYISPEHLVDILKGMTHTDIYDAWYDTFPIAGVDGTIRNRMKGTAAEGNVRAKTGTISNTRGLSGYVTTAGGEKLVFSFIVNAHSTTNAATEDVTDGVAVLLANYGVEPAE